jgi:hypothetical protein
MPISITWADFEAVFNFAILPLWAGTLPYIAVAVVFIVFAHVLGYAARRRT